MTLSTHVLDATSGRPAAGVHVSLRSSDDWVLLAGAATDTDGRIAAFDTDDIGAGRYCLVFETGGYFGERGVATFYPEVVVSFEITEAGAHHHVPLLLSPFAYSTYRGS
jgi:5-hydroxyisourate hydrolase